ncbi:MAG: hypothetical protein JWO53_1379, partial [Chlamydiia bacterium]|nr:hypothetical protein [Chlamydiia bacterium]
MQPINTSAHSLGSIPQEVSDQQKALQLVQRLNTFHTQYPQATVGESVKQEFFKLLQSLQPHLPFLTKKQLVEVLSVCAPLINPEQTLAHQILQEIDLLIERKGSRDQSEQELSVKEILSFCTSLKHCIDRHKNALTCLSVAFEQKIASCRCSEAIDALSVLSRYNTNLVTLFQNLLLKKKENQLYDLSELPTRELIALSQA